MPVDPDRLREAVLQAKNYRDMGEETVGRLCAAAAPKYDKLAQAVKAVKTQLHTSHGAFFPPGCHREAARLLREEGETLRQGGEAARELTLRLLSLHPSSRERLPELGRLAEFLAPVTERAGELLDLGCGFWPMALPLLPRGERLFYRAGDVDRATVALLNRYFSLGVCRGEALLTDAAGKLPEADAAFLFKLLPVLEQQERGFSRRLLERLPAGEAVISFPIKSLSGREKGMEQFYTQWFGEALPEGWEVLRREIIGSELFYHCRRRAARQGEERAD